MVPGKRRLDSSRAIEEAVYELVRAYVAEQIEGDETLLARLKKLRVSDAVAVCKNSEYRFRRLKDQQIKPAVEKAIAVIRTEEEARAKEEPQKPEDFDSDFEGVDPSTLMDVKDTNQLNKSVTSLWNIKPADVPTQPSSGQSTPVAPQSTSAAADAAAAAAAAKKKEEKKARKKEKKLAERKPNSSVTLSDLGGIDSIITQVMEVIAMPMMHPEVYCQIGSDIPRGVLLHGPPGCGKTMLANALANELDVTFLNVSAPSVVSGMSGESEKKLRDIFDEAKSLAPCIIFIDEIDAITPKRESAQREMERRIVAQLLTCMDDVALEKTGGRPVMVIGATNRPDSIDAALRRGGRFDWEICMNVPDQDSREKILRTISKKLKLEGDFDFKRLAKMTPGYVGADLHSLVAAAGVCAIKRIFKDLDKFDANGSATTEAQAIEASAPEEEATNEPKEDGMDVDAEISRPAEPESESTEIPEKLDASSVIQKFLSAHPEPLSESQLAPLAISFDDFVTALPTVQPSSKREGFATVPDVTWEDVGAMNTIREELEYAIVEPIKSPEIYQSFGIQAPSGVLLWGPPGCGKTLLAKAVANESQANFISVRGPELLNKYVGESERAVRQVFTRARASTPCVIFFDELDALVPHRDDTNSEASSRVVNTLLTELDGVGDRNGVYVIAATNRPDMIDSAMLRPGRLDKQLYVELPTGDERLEILKTVTRSSPLDPSVNLSVIAHDERCRNYSGADLAALTREAATLALKSAIQRKRAANAGDMKVLIGPEHFEQAISKMKPSVSDMDRQKYEHLKARLGSEA